MRYDYTFCLNRDCPNTDCQRYCSRVPVGVPVSMADLSCGGDSCEYYIEPDDGMNLNTVSEDVLASIGFGKKRAMAIVAYRAANGGFKCVEELLEVPGIGIKTYLEVKDRVYVK